MPLTPDEERRLEQEFEAREREALRVGESLALLRIIASAARRVLRADYEAAREIVERVGIARALSELAELFLPGSVERWRERMRPVITDVVTAATEPKEEVLGVSFDERNPRMAEFLETYVSELAGRVSQTTHDQVVEVIREAQDEGLSVPKTAERIRERSDIESRRRAELIARNELQRTSKGASWVQALESGVVSGKRRHEMDDLKTRPEHRELDGEERAIDEPYSNGELWAGQLDINCRGWDEFLIDFDALGV